MSHPVEETAWLSPAEGPQDLSSIKSQLLVRCFDFKIIQPLNTLFRSITLEWGETESAHAERRGNKSVIQLGRQFFTAQVRTLDDSCDIIMHELCHHLMKHLTHCSALDRRYGHEVMNVAEDALINAYLFAIGSRKDKYSSMGFAGFMDRFYPDKGYAAFLRPFSKNGSVTGKECEEPQLLWSHTKGCETNQQKQGASERELPTKGKLSNGLPNTFPRGAYVLNEEEGQRILNAAEYLRLHYCGTNNCPIWLMDKKMARVSLEEFLRRTEMFCIRSPDCCKSLLSGNRLSINTNVDYSDDKQTRFSGRMFEEACLCRCRETED
jgi:hypothetical protein